ncbi:MAG: hypothetical protein ABJC26_09435, partial [Gemmatimonadaceae bacterium]
GNGNFRIAFEPVAPEKLPDYFPPIRQGSTHADEDGNLWVLPSSSTITGADLAAAAAGGRGGRGGGRGGAGGFGGGGGGGGGGADTTGRGARAPGDTTSRGGRGAGPDLPQAPLVSLNYDIVNRKGEIVERLQLPAGRTIAGFGPNGAVYLSSREGRNVFLERYKRN